ncbi:MAG: cyanophycinase [Treponema sp.]|nr:cyanophycinase [Treponema sp.]
MSQGDLFIAGGNLSTRSRDVHSAFVKAAGGPGGRFAVLGAASKVPRAGFESFRTSLESLGVDPSRIELLPAAAAVPGWEGGGRDPSVAERAARADGFWMLGGDQNALADILLEADGSDGPLLAALRRAHGDGAPLGGSSAGAAVMSDPMIAGGTSFGALALPRARGAADTEISRALYVRRGLGFFPGGIVDQHFDARARLGRLLEACLVEDGGGRPAFGISEDTALVWRAAENRAEVLGAGGVFILDPRDAVRDLPAGRTRIRGVRLHYLTEGDSFRLSDRAVEFRRKEPLGSTDPAFDVPRPQASGVLSEYGTLADFAFRMLLDNRPEGLLRDPDQGFLYVRSFLVEEGDDGLPRAWEIRLGRTEGVSRGWTGDRFGFENVLVDILPAEIEFRIVP